MRTSHLFVSISFFTFFWKSVVSLGQNIGCMLQGLSLYARHWFSVRGFVFLLSKSSSLRHVYVSGCTYAALRLLQQTYADIFFETSSVDMEQFDDAIDYDDIEGFDLEFDLYKAYYNRDKLVPFTLP